MILRAWEHALPRIVVDGVTVSSWPRVIVTVVHSLNTPHEPSSPAVSLPPPVNEEAPPQVFFSVPPTLTATLVDAMTVCSTSTSTVIEEESAVKLQPPGACFL